MLPNLPPTLQLPTPPESSRKRRQALRDSDDSGADMAIEDYLIARDSYRSTTLPPAWPHPLQLQHAPELQIRLAPLNNGIFVILESHGLPDDVLFLPYHATKALYPGN